MIERGRIVEMARLKRAAENIGGKIVEGITKSLEGLLA